MGVMNKRADTFTESLWVLGDFLETFENVSVKTPGFVRASADGL